MTELSQAKDSRDGRGLLPDGPREALAEGLDRAARNIEFYQRELMKDLEDEKQALARVERTTSALNAEVEKRVAIEAAIRSLSADLDVGESASGSVGGGRGV